MSDAFAQQTLKCAAAVMILWGGLVGLGAHQLTDRPMAIFADLLFWPLDGLPLVDSPAVRLLCAVSGGLMIGWGLMLWQVATRLWNVDKALAAAMFKTSGLSWFAVDSLGSLAAGAYLNVAGNVLFLAAFLVPVFARTVQTKG